MDDLLRLGGEPQEGRLSKHLLEGEKTAEEDDVLDCPGAGMWPFGTTTPADRHRRDRRARGHGSRPDLGGALTIYRVQFPVVRQYEADTWYDRNGRIVFTGSKGLPGVGLPRKARKDDIAYGLRTQVACRSGIALGWDNIQKLREGVVTCHITDDTLPGAPVERTIEHHAPFDRCDREADHLAAWEPSKVERRRPLPCTIRVSEHARRR